MTVTKRILDSLDAISAEQWNGLAGDDPVMSHAFLNALCESRSASAATGWRPQFLTLWSDDELIGAMPLFEKDHSYGEYVFDWAWARAYAQRDLRYYPKLLCAIPFTPVPGSRLLVKDGTYQTLLLDAAIQLVRDRECSSLHVLFPTPSQALDMSRHGLLLREGVQFHWENASYSTFDYFLSALSHHKRKKIKQERRRIQDAGISFRRLEGADVTRADWEFFYRCYTRTYAAHGSSPYLTFDFFLRIAETMPRNILLIKGYRGSAPLCSSLYLHNERTLLGRYWGTMEFVSSLHFETCYYQAIEFCIERQIERFEGGAQGEHKLARGFLPTITYSAHWFSDHRFAHAIDEYLKLETAHVRHAIDELNESNPYRNSVD